MTTHLSITAPDRATIKAATSAAIDIIDDEDLGRIQSAIGSPLTITAIIEGEDGETRPSPSTADQIRRRMRHAGVEMPQEPVMVMVPAVMSPHAGDPTISVSVAGMRISQQRRLAAGLRAAFPHAAIYGMLHGPACRAYSIPDAERGWCRDADVEEKCIEIIAHVRGSAS
jgi:hypothetical protein